jgi:flagellar hook-length control protein FliK
MVLPQTSPQGPQSDSGVKSGSGGHDKNGDSSFDAVSRAEQQRLDKKQAEKRDQARAAEKARKGEVRQERNSDKRPDDSREPPADATSRNTDSHDGEQADESAITADTASEADGVVPQEGAAENLPEEAIPLTFAGLQALLMPAEGSAQPLAAGNNVSQAGCNGVMP